MHRGPLTRREERQRIHTAIFCCCRPPHVAGPTHVYVSLIGARANEQGQSLKPQAPSATSQLPTFVGRSAETHAEPITETGKSTRRCDTGKRAARNVYVDSFAEYTPYIAQLHAPISMGAVTGAWQLH